jgi:asparagine synthase (glutamine-hydrolysing)
MSMRIEVTPAGLRSKTARRVEVARRIYLLFSDLPRLTERAAGPSPMPLERDLRDSGVSYVVADDDTLSVVADFRGNQHLYCHWTRGAAGPELTITDDLLSFAGRLAIDDDVARLVPLMKFVPPSVCLLRGLDRVAPGMVQVYDRRTLEPIKRESFLPELFGGGATPVTRSLVRDTLTSIVAEEARSLPKAIVFLSGGSDSALLVHLLKRCGHPLEAVTAAFDTPVGRRETALAAATAAHYGVPWHSTIIDKAETLRHLPRLLAAVGEPFADVALAPEAILGLALRQQIGDPSGPIPVFEGEGMDSLMCGSYKFVVEHYRDPLAPLLACVPQAALAGADRRTRFGALKLKVAQTKALLQGGALFERHLRFLLDEDFSTYVPSALRDKVAAAFGSLYDMSPQLEPLNRIAMMTFEGNIPNLENRKLRTIAEYAGIDFHLAFQDPRFIRLAMSIPVNDKIGMGYGKRIIKEAFRDVLPPHALTRRKGSFVPPVFDWIYPEYEELLLSSRLFKQEEIRRRIHENVKGRQDHLSFLWALVVTESWIQRYESQRAEVLTSPAG